MHKYIAFGAAIVALLFSTTFKTIGLATRNSKAVQSLSEPSTMFNQQQEPTQERKPGQRCLPKRADKCTRPGEENRAPEVEMKVSEEEIIVPCQDGKSSESCTPSTSQKVRLQTSATDADGDSLSYEYSSTGGRIQGEGTEVEWDLIGVLPGTYTATVGVDDQCGCVSFTSRSVTLKECPDCK